MVCHRIKLVYGPAETLATHNATQLRDTTLGKAPNPSGLLVSSDRTSESNNAETDHVGLTLAASYPSARAEKASYRLYRICKAGSL